MCKSSVHTIVDEIVLDKTRDVKKRKPDARRLSQIAIRHVSDGPILQSKQKWLSPRLFGEDIGRETHDSLTYAQAVSSPQGLARHVQTAPISNIQETFPSNAPMTQPSVVLQPDLSKQDSIDNESEAPPSIFDEDHDDVDKLSDFATEISSSTVSDHGLPPDIDPDERLVYPHKYLSELQDLEANVAGNSGLFLMKQANRQLYPLGDNCDLHFSFDCFSPQGRTVGAKSYDESIIGMCQKKPGDGRASLAFHLLECRNLMLAVVSNIERMKVARFCQKSINVLTIDKARPQVAQLIGLSLDSIIRMHKMFEAAAEDIAQTADTGDFMLGPKTQKIIQCITSECRNLLIKLKLPPAEAQVSVWRKAILVLDLAVVSYCGAHIERFDEKFLAENLDFAKITTAWTYDRTCVEGIMLRRRQLRCLDGFLGGQRVWVLQSQALWNDHQDLYLSSDIDQLADIWGPLWSVKSSQDSDDILRYDAGPGSILPCATGKNMPPLANGEVLCHWFRHDDEPDDVPTGRLLSSSRLLIGASTIVEQKTSQLKENELCKNHRSTVLQQLRQANCVEELGTRRPTTYVAENQVMAQVGAYGVALGGSRVYKVGLL